MVASLGHDLDHTGYTNNFEIKSRSKLALLYSDQSPLEFHHIHILFQEINKPGSNIFANLTPEDKLLSRQIII